MKNLSKRPKNEVKGANEGQNEAFFSAKKIKKCLWPGRAHGDMLYSKYGPRAKKSLWFTRFWLAKGKFSG
jgi:hypothetical protein